MRKFAVLFPAALVALVAAAPMMNAAVAQAPTLSVKATYGRILWTTKNAYYVTITPVAGELPANGMRILPAGTYCVSAVGERGRTTCTMVTVK